MRATGIILMVLGLAAIFLNPQTNDSQIFIVKLGIGGLAVGLVVLLIGIYLKSKKPV
jgi:hypothetical protein